MKTLRMLLIFSALFFSYNLYCQSNEFQPERLITDYNGVVYNGNNILCYGDYGVITFSRNLGNSWHQYSIGDKHNIRKIITNGKDFYGISQYAVFKSTNNGIDWEIKELYETAFELYSIVNVENSIFILSTKGILELDLDLNIKGFVVNDSFSNSTRELSEKNNNFVSDGYNLYYSTRITEMFIEDNDTTYISSNIIRKYNIDSKKLDTIRYIFSENCQFCELVTEFKYNNDILYATAHKKLVQSTNQGSFWDIVNDKLNWQDSVVYNFTNSEIRFIINGQYKDQEMNNSTFTPFYAKLNNLGDTVHLFVNKPTERHLTHTINYTELLKIKDNILIAVGKNKFIAMSYNDGENWEIKSFFKSESKGNRIVGTSAYTYIENSLTYFYNRDTMFISGGTELSPMMKTTNKGVTWLTPKFNHSFTSYYTVNMIYNHYGYGAYFIDHLQLLKYSKFTNDFGETYFNSDIKIPDSYIMRHKQIELDNESIFTLYGQDAHNLFSMLYIFNAQLNSIDSIRIDSVRISNIIKTLDEQLMTIGLRKANYLNTNSNKIDVYQENRYVILSSSDNGRTWTEIKIEIPFEPIPDMLIPDKFHEVIRSIYYFDDLVIIPKFYDDITLEKIYDINMKILYVYDLKTNKFDSLEIPISLSRSILNNGSTNNIFTFRAELYFISSDFNLYYTNSLRNNDIKWNTIEMGHYINDWESHKATHWNPTTDLGKYVIYSGWSDTEQIYLLIGKSTNIYNSQVDGNTFTDFEINILQMFKSEPTSITEEQIEYNPVLLYSTQPYPNPTSNIVYSELYWNSLYNIEDAELSIFNTNGVKISPVNIEINKISSYNALLSWDCSGINPGIYFIHINLKGSKRTIAVVVMK